MFPVSLRLIDNKGTILVNHGVPCWFFGGARGLGPARHRAPDALDAGTAPAQRNRALIDAPSAAPAPVSVSGRGCCLGRCRRLGHAIWCARAIIGDEPFAIFLPAEVMIGATGCMKQMVESYNAVGGNLVAVRQQARCGWWHE